LTAFEQLLGKLKGTGAFGSVILPANAALASGMVSELIIVVGMVVTETVSVLRVSAGMGSVYIL